MSGNLSDDSQPQNGSPPFRGSDASESAICSGARFGNYLVRELIGVGDTASVYRAHDTRLLREVALKVLNTGVLAGADGLARFLHEARMAAAIRHPNVVGLFDVGVHDGTPYIVMELLAGEDLDVRLNAVRNLPEPVVIDIAVQLVRGLTAVHDAGVVHRDLKPSNVFLARGPEGSTQAKLLDFGVSKQMRDHLRLTTNGRRRWAAMPLYTAPEVLRDGEATFHSDQYSLGVLLYECVTGLNPFRADTARGSIDLITTGQPARINRQALRPSRRLGAIIERAMHFYPGERFADMRELGRALTALSERRAWWGWGSSPAPGVARGPSSKPSKPPSTAFGRTERSGHRLGSAIGAAVLACSIAAPLIAWSVRRHRPAAPVRVASPLTVDDVRARPPTLPTSNTPSANAPSVNAPSVNASSALACATPSSTPSRAIPPPPVIESPAPVSSTPLHTAPLHVASVAPLLAAPPPPKEFASPAEVGEAAPHADPARSALPVASASEDDVVGSIPPEDAGAAGVVDAGDAVDVAPSSVTRAPSGPRRGTNGALIFD